MRLIDEKGRLFGRLSIIDLLVVLAVVVMAAALYVKNDRLSLSGGKVSGGEVGTITIQVQLRGVRRYIVDAIRVDEEVYDNNYSSGNQAVGVVTGVEITRDPGSVITAMGDGTAGLVEVEDSVDALVTVQATGAMENGNCVINGTYYLGVNSAREYYTRRVKFTGTVENISLEVP